MDFRFHLNKEGEDVKSDGLYQEVAQAKHRMEQLYSLWSVSDPLYEEERWLAYQSALHRYNALLTEAKGQQKSVKFVLPWLAS